MLHFLCASMSFAWIRVIGKGEEKLHTLNNHFGNNSLQPVCHSSLKYRRLKEKTLSLIKNLLRLLLAKIEYIGFWYVFVVYLFLAFSFIGLKRSFENCFVFFFFCILLSKQIFFVSKLNFKKLAQKQKLVYFKLKSSC